LASFADGLQKKDRIRCSWTSAAWATSCRFRFPPSGVGPTLALKILSGMSVEELVPAIRGSDLARLTQIPGVGRKTAERMVVELKDKLESVALEAGKPAAASPAGVQADVISALVNLGYDARAAENAVGEAKRETGVGNFEKLLRAALQSLTAPKGRAARP
jgi:Holliday junction DNA helicase RuvA